MRRERVPGWWFGDRLEPGSVELLGDRALDDQIADVCLDPGGLVMADEIQRIRICLWHGDRL